jgi:CRP/FNR family cyclic AMP-dependent transcriptional regulator
MALTVVEKVIMLQNVDVFASVPTEQLGYMAAIAEVVALLEGDVVYREGDESNALYVVVDGSIRLHRDQETITTASRSDAFGTWAVLDAEPRVTTATVVTDARLLRIDRDDFLELLADHSEITQGVFKTVAGRMRRLLGRMQVDPPGGTRP